VGPAAEKRLEPAHECEAALSKPSTPVGRRRRRDLERGDLDRWCLQRRRCGACGRQ
jgi:hypothetical protein